jgi:hypothetical protein
MEIKMRKILVLASLMFASAVANASYLYWQVSPSEYTDATWDTASLYFFEGPLTDYPSLSGATAQGNVAYISPTQTVTFDDPVTQVSPTLAGGYVADIGTLTDSTSYSYFVELSNAGQRVGFGAIATFDGGSTPQYVYSDTGDISVALSNLASVTPWHASSYGPVPEPTSAILMLFGAAFLGFKRKNRSIA